MSTSVEAAPKPAAALDLTRLPKETNLWRDAIRRYFQNRLAVFGLVVLVILAFIAITADFTTPYPYDYSVVSEALQFPNADHLLGTDAVGRDFLSRLMYGARISLAVGIGVQLIALGIGVPLGTLAGLLGGKADWLIMRAVEVMTAIPVWILALFLIALLGNGLLNVILAIGLVSWLDPCRLVRAQLLQLREREIILGARSIGATSLDIARRHLLPNALTPLIISVTFGIPSAIFTEASISFVGLGINDPLPSWGKMVADASSYVQVYWHLGLFPTFLIALTMLSFSFAGDGLRDALDPYLNK